MNFDVAFWPWENLRVANLQDEDDKFSCLYKSHALCISNYRGLLLSNTLTSVSLDPLSQLD